MLHFVLLIFCVNKGSTIPGGFLVLEHQTSQSTHQAEVGGA